MITFTTKQGIKSYLTKHKAQNKSIGFVPTMGALHEGHLSLVTRAMKKNDLVVVSIFVNPTQFNNPKDLANYPNTIAIDKALLENMNCDVLFLPSVEEMYNDQVRADSFDFEGLDTKMEGKFRAGHFDGVGTIVKQLFTIVNPDRAYFGQKDFQQLMIIKMLVKKERLDVKVKGCPILREENGLAMSSRNLRLTAAQRKEADFIYKTLRKVKKKFSNKSLEEINKWVSHRFAKHPLFELEYFTIAEEKTLETATTINPDKKYRAFIAVFVGEIRLIDNVRLKLKR